MLGHELTKIYGSAGLPDNTIQLDFEGSAGQSIGAFMPKGITLRLEGDANDHVGKGLSGGRLAIFPHRSATFAAEEQVIAGNVVLYGATSGQVFIRGRVGERFCVRNSGADAVVEGIGDHGCEYMTGGRAIVLGPTGRNFGAGMSGGVAYVYDPDGTFTGLVNREMVDLDPLNTADAAAVKQLVELHQAETGSTVARRVLAGWVSESHNFVKVIPKDFKRVIKARKLAESEGRDPVKAIMEAAHG